jgi:hypothetical protein
MVQEDPKMTQLAQLAQCHPTHGIDEVGDFVNAENPGHLWKTCFWAFEE